jgi:hypothetical protein
MDLNVHANETLQKPLTPTGLQFLDLEGNHSFRVMDCELLTVGRNPDADIPIDVSHFHSKQVEVSYCDGVCTITDFWCRLFVNGIKIPSDIPFPVNVGDTVVMASIKFRICSLHEKMPAEEGAKQ